MFSVAEINTPEKLASFSLIWQTLWDRTRHRSFFQTRDWLNCYWRRFGAERKLRVLMVLSATKPIGIVPLVIKRAETSLGSLRVLTYPLDGWGPFFGPIGSDPTATMYGALKHLAETPRDWDLLDLRGIDEDRVDKGRTANAFHLADLPMTPRVWERNLEVPVCDWTTGDQFLIRRRMKEAEKELRQRGGWEFVRSRVTAADPMEALQSRWLLEEALPLLASDVTSAAWLTDMQTASLCSGTSDICALRVDGKITAAALASVASETLVLIAAGMDGDAGDADKTMLFGQMMLDGLDRGDSSYVFGPRTAAWAADWMPIHRPSYRFTYFAGYKPRAQLLRLNELRKRWWSSAATA
jgi:CelD/BcsL family acetyltransferase involved in cellulose biosynthesis